MFFPSPLLGTTYRTPATKTKLRSINIHNSFSINNDARDYLGTKKHTLIDENALTSKYSTSLRYYITLALSLSVLPVNKLVIIV